ncbi:MAG: putative glycoside hydrolase [Thermoleophilia bacterium]
MGEYLSRPRARGRRAAGPVLLLLLVGAVIAFVGGFSLFWGIGSRVAGGEFHFGLPKLGGGTVVAAEDVAREAAPRDYPVSVAFDPVRYRDSTYVPVKGIFISSWIAGSPELFAKQVALADRTEINAMVIDVKDATGYVSYDTNVALADELGLEEHRIKDMDALMATLREHGIVPIARIVAFNDPKLSAARPEWGVQHKDGGLWKDDSKNRHSYTNPYNREVWEYLVELAEDAADHGFREIQWDYVRFPSDGKISDAVYPGRDGSKEDAIAAFLAFSRERLEKKGVWVSADVFGLTVHVRDDLGIGQRIEKVARNVDIVSPMVYPSHYDPGAYNIKNPNREPYKIIKNAMADAGRRLSGTGAIVRPWLQDFSLYGVTYGVEEVKAQIKAVEEQGYVEWILWDPAVKYTEGALRAE